VRAHDLPYTDFYYISLFPQAVQLKRKNVRIKLIIAAIITAAIMTVVVVLAILLGVFIPMAT
jgi:threonine/homoserine/homoserine lactone efflux protein